MKKLTEWKQVVVVVSVIVIFALAAVWKGQLQKRQALKQEKAAQEVRNRAADGAMIP